jgi:hypothetical protein
MSRLQTKLHLGHRVAVLQKFIIAQIRSAQPRSGILDVICLDRGSLAELQQFAFQLRSGSSKVIISVPRERLQRWDRLDIQWLGNEITSATGILTAASR